MKITKQQLQRVVKEELAALKKEGYGDALDREHEERARERRRQSARIDKERERNRTRGSRTGTQGEKSTELRGVIPVRLCEEILNEITVKRDI